jgi:para-aminobenzoate synthetase component 1
MTLIEIGYVDPLEAVARLSRRDNLAFLDSAMRHETLGRWSYLAADPFGRFRVEDGIGYWNGAAIEGSPVAALRGALERYRRPAIEGGPPFQGGAIGSFAYEAGRLFETLPLPARPSHPLRQLDLGFYDCVLAFDLMERRSFIVAQDGAKAARLREQLREDPPSRLPAPALDWHDSRDRAAYEAEVARVIRYIRDGDIFQANLSHRFTATPDHPPDPVATYRALRHANPAPFSALIVDGKRFIASTSPERFLRLCGRQVETRPIKGTIRRGRNPAEDASLSRRLADSEKDRAENVMIVDLLRNDLSRVCEPGSVAVPSLCEVESYASVHHLTSVVTGRLSEGRDMIDLIAATFPGGSITGAPKIRAMEIIAELEGEARGAYCGSIGWLGFDGSADLNIAIRTLAFDGRDMTVGAGGGITLLSAPAAEYDETLAKAERILTAISLSKGVRPGEAA